MFTNDFVRKTRARLQVELLEDRTAPATLVGLTTNNFLITFDSAAPTQIQRSVPISGLPTGQDIVSIDARPANGLIYGVTNANLLYTLNPYTGVATRVGVGLGVFAQTGKVFGADFDPASDRLRVVTSNHQNLRINPNDGVVVDGDNNAGNGLQPDTPLAFAVGDPHAGANVNVNDIAYDRNFQGTIPTTAFGIDVTLHALVRIGGVDGAQPAGSGVVTTIGNLGFAISPRLGFDIGADGTAYAALKTTDGITRIYTINLVTGHASNPGKIGNGLYWLDGLTVLPREEVVYGVTQSNRLVKFRASDPGTLLSAMPLRGLLAGENVTAIDFRPASGELFGLTSVNRVLRIDPATGNTVQVGSSLVTSPQFTAGSPAGFDFNPVTDRLRLVNAANDNLRFNPLTFTPEDSDANAANGNTPDTSLAYIGTDGHVGANPNVVASAYDRNDNNAATATTLFGIDSTLNTLVRQGAVDGNSGDAAGGGSPNGGLLTTIGSLGVDPTDNVGFDIIDQGTLGSGAALAVMQLNGETVSKLFSINLSTGLANQPAGSATLIGTIGGGEVLTAMAIAPPTIQFAAPIVRVYENAGKAVIAITRTGGTGATATVRFDTVDGTALAVRDYTAVNNYVVTFNPGETTKYVVVVIKNNSRREPTKSFSMTLTSVAGGNTVLGDLGTARVDILNDDA